MRITDFLQEFSSEGIYTRHAVDENPDDCQFFTHFHERCEIFYFISGNADFLVEGARYPLGVGSLLIMRPTESHRVKILGGEQYERYAVNFPVSAMEGIDPEHRLLKAFFERPLGRGNLFLPMEFGEENILAIFTEMCGKSSRYEMTMNIKTHLYWLIDRINRAWLKRGSADYAHPQNISERVVLHVNSHLFEEISVSALAEYFSLSASQFNRIFRQATGVAPWDYITTKRLVAAREKIRGGEAVQRVAEGCCFGDYSSFYRAYVKHFGCSPKQDVGSGKSEVRKS